MERITMPMSDYAIKELLISMSSHHPARFLELEKKLRSLLNVKRWRCLKNHGSKNSSRTTKIVELLVMIDDVKDMGK